MKIQKMLVWGAIGLGITTAGNWPVWAKDDAQLAPASGQAEQVLKLQKALEAAGQRQNSPNAAATRSQAAEQLLTLQRDLEELEEAAGKQVSAQAAPVKPNLVPQRGCGRPLRLVAA